MAGVIRLIEAAVQHDPGHRGIKALIRPGNLELASKSLAAASSVLLLTGFPCLIDSEVPTETDGPPGAVFLASSLRNMRIPVSLATDDCNAATLRAAADAVANLSAADVHSFPPDAPATPESPLAQLVRRHSHVVAVERAGQAADGRWYTMSGRDMSHLVAPFDAAVDAARDAGDVTVIGIGDGGNELGMGALIDAVRAHIPNGATIGCVTRASPDCALVAGVSNWGAVALAAATAHARGPVAAAQAARPSSLLPDEAAERAVLLACIRAGARDGVRARAGTAGGSNEEALLSVDGMDLEVHLAVSREVRRLLDGGDA